MNLFLLATSFLSFSLLAWRWRSTIEKIRDRKALYILLILILLICFSCLWSSFPGNTIRRTIVLLQVTVFAVYFATRFKPQEQLQLLGWTFGLAALGSLILIFIFPEYGVMGMGKELVIGGQEIAHAGSWRGLYVHKNALGRIMTLGAITTLLLANSSRSYRWLLWLQLGLMLFLVISSESSTAIIVTLTIMVLVPVLRVLRFKTNLLIILGIPTFILLMSSLVIILGSAETFTAVFGKDLTFSGRTELWTAVLDEIFQQPLLGYGYKGYWRGFLGPSAVIWAQFPWLPPHSHNALLDISLDLGLLGLLTFLFSFSSFLALSISWIRRSKGFCALFPAIFLVFVFLSNITESSVLQPNLLWILYLTVPFLIDDKQYE